MGPHAKRIYMHYFKKYSFQPKLIIELVSKKKEVLKYLKDNDFNCETFFIFDEIQNYDNLPHEIQFRLQKKINDMSITDAIISTEPKGHLAYLQFFLEQNVNILTDKPLTAPINISTEHKMAQKIEDDYNRLVKMYNIAKEKGTSFEIQCQRRWHTGYLHIRNLLKEIVNEYGVPITKINLSHCDGMWVMPNEYLSRENHPYKYGYGKLMHSGYHFIDLLAWLIKVNDSLADKKIDNGEMYTATTHPDDCLKIIDNNNYKKLFNTEKFNSLFNNTDDYKFNEFGEVDFHSLIKFKSGKNTITTSNLNLLQSGFSRRSWLDEPKDTYKGNGRVRHEHVDIQVGPLMNIQVHSYQSKEIKEFDKTIQGEVGSLEHFDIYIFRNQELVGGEVFEKIHLKDMVTDDNDRGFIGYNEQAREQCIIDFLTGKASSSDLLDHKISIQLLKQAYISMCKRHKGLPSIVNFELENL